MDKDEDEIIPSDQQSEARTHLANERTFLAWLRTGITFVALGLAAAQFLARDIIPGIPITRWLAIVMVGSGVFVALAGAQRYFVDINRIRQGKYLPAHYSVIFTAVMMVVIGLLSIVFIIVLRH